MKNVFCFIQIGTKEGTVARIIEGYTSLKKIKRAGLKVKGDRIEKFESRNDARKFAQQYSPDVVKTHVA